MTLDTLLQIIEDSSLKDSDKSALKKQLEDNGLSQETRKKVVQAFKKHIAHLDHEMNTLDAELKKIVKETAPGLYSEFTQEVDKEEQMRIIDAQAAAMMNAVEEDFNEDLEAVDAVLDAIDTNLTQQKAKALAE